MIRIFRRPPALNAAPTLPQLLWVVFWALAAMGLASAFGSAGSTAGGLVVFFMLISLWWGVQVFQNVALFVTAAAVGHWWYSPNPSAVVVGSFRRAFTTSFGSIALGSLIVAVVRALEGMARAAENRARERGNGALVLAACCLRCMLASLGGACAGVRPPLPSDPRPYSLPACVPPQTSFSTSTTGPSFRPR